MYLRNVCEHEIVFILKPAQSLNNIHISKRQISLLTMQLPDQRITIYCHVYE
jgi:hypothetical protein